MSLRAFDTSVVASNGLYEGIVGATPSSAGEPIPVQIPAFDTDLDWGPADWTPQASNWPQEGDRCVVAFAQTDSAGEPSIWILAWTNV